MSRLTQPVIPPDADPKGYSAGLLTEDVDGMIKNLSDCRENLANIIAECIRDR
jgi:hypothetical protein